MQDILVDNERAKKEIGDTASTSNKKQTDNFITEIKPQKERIEWIVVLRAFACMAVVMLHIFGIFWEDFKAGKTFILSEYDPVRQVINRVLFQPLSYFGVACFFMISGRLMLDPSRNVTISKLIKKIIKLTIVFILFNFLYFLLVSDFTHLSFFDVMSVLYFSLTHTTTTWYMVILIGLYLLTPILRIFVKNAEKKVVLYVLIALFISSLLIPTINRYFGLSFIVIIGETKWIFLFLVGYYLSSTNFIPSKCIYILGLLGFSAYTIGSYFSVSDQLDAFMVLEAMMIFKLFANHKIKIKNNKVINLISKYSFGIYLTNYFWMRFFAYQNIYFTIFPIFIGEFVYFAYILILSLLSSMILYRLPLIKKLFK